MRSRESALAEAATATATARHSQERFCFLAEHTTDLLSRHDLDGHFPYASPAARRLLRREPEDLLGRPVDDLVHPDDREVLATARHRVPGDRPGVAQFRVRHGDGRWIWVESTATAVNVAGGVPEILASSRDVTARKDVEASLEAPNADLATANEELARSNDELSDFAHVVSHDLAEPLQVIAGFTDLLAADHADRLDNTGRGHLGLIRSAARRLEDLISDLLRVAERRQCAARGRGRGPHGRGRGGGGPGGEAGRGAERRDPGRRHARRVGGSRPVAATVPEPRGQRRQVRAR